MNGSYTSGSDNDQAHREIRTDCHTSRCDILVQIVGVYAGSNNPSSLRTELQASVMCLIPCAGSLVLRTKAHMVNTCKASLCITYLTW